MKPIKFQLAKEENMLIRVWAIGQEPIPNGYYRFPFCTLVGTLLDMNDGLGPCIVTAELFFKVSTHLDARHPKAAIYIHKDGQEHDVFVYFAYDGVRIIAHVALADHLADKNEARTLSIIASQYWE